MTLNFIQNGDIFNSKCKFLVNPTNKAGIMGKGLALEFKNRFPEVYKQYKEICDDLSCGNYFNVFFDQASQLGIICFYTKKHWKDSSKLEDIEEGIKRVSNLIKNTPAIESIAFPALGCGLGGLSWKDVKPLFVKYFKDIETNKIIEIYEPK